MSEETFDVVVVGGGGSGLAAAIEARRFGCTTLLLEKNPQLGGSTALAIGSISATGTPHQLKQGIRDNPADHCADMRLFAKPELASRDNAELRRILCDEAPDTFRWLMALGVRFYGPMPEPPHRQPRMHNVLPNALSYIYHLEREARRAGVDIRLSQRVADLLLDNGRAIGVVVNSANRPQRIVARGGVVLATGDFTNNPELKARYMGETAAKVIGLNVTATGDGQAMALRAGARILNGDLALGPQIRFIPPPLATLAHRLPPWAGLAAFMQWALDHMPQALLRPLIMSFLTTALAPSPTLFTNGAILINKNGERFCDERDRPAFALPDQPDKVGYILIDQRIATIFSSWPNYISTAPGVAYAYVPDYRRNRADVYTEAPSLEVLAGMLKVDAATLEQTVARQKGVAGATATESATSPPPLGDGPFIALGPVRSIFVHSEGGLAVDDHHRVLGPGDRPIAGLFAAGSTGQGGLLLDGHGHHLVWAFVSGRRAGRIAAAAAKAML